MAKTNKLIIVESPTKVKAIKKFLGAGYEVAASNGHVRDLPKSQLGIDVEHDYEPKYITIRGKGELLSSLRKQVAKADVIYLATDPDREGEAISWHLIAALKLNEMPGKKVFRITFNEITKKAVRESLEHARGIDMNLVDAQQARRALDRVVGYRISPLLWAKVKRGLSAGRVQSVALRMIADREAEIDAFIPEEYWTIDADFTVAGLKKPVTAHYYGTQLSDGTQEKAAIASKEEADRLLAELKNADYRVAEVKVSDRVRKAPAPFTTSTLQQEASKVLGFSTLKTMRIAQQLYEGIDIKGIGTVGLITYLRTDSIRISDEAQQAAEQFITGTYGDTYPAAPAEKKQTARIQDAHEAIRPSDITRTPEQIAGSLSRDQLRLYQLIWRRFTASRMADARYEQTRVRIEAPVKDARTHIFTMSFSRLIFDGFLKVYDPGEESEETDKKADKNLGNVLQKDEKLETPTFDPEQHFTQPQPHYTEASLVKALEEKGIGRPSTYAPTISTILARRYITKEGKNLYMTEVGEVVNDIMLGSFPTIVDPGFTANMENSLDSVAEGNTNWKSILENFYPDLEKSVEQAEKDLEKVKIADEETEEVCEKCGRHMVIKYGPHGKFLACPGFPECRNTKPYYEKIGVACPKCGQDIVIMKSKKGRKFYGCINSECDFMSWQRPTGEKCPRCGSALVEKGNKVTCMNSECGYVAEEKISTRED
ncbi:MAG: type I DNA topoisomerase [Lachnospiraceae bacterium]|nr:type I DNA topoisomerase [Lachnospiraceae bacterium]